MSNATTGSDRVVPDQQPPEAEQGSERGSRLTRLTRPAVTHWQFAVVVAAAVVVRLYVILVYPPILWFNDSYNYIYDAVTHIPDRVRPNGYPFFLDLLLPLHSAYPLAVLQAAMGVAMGVAIYALLRHRGLPWWGAILPTLPVLFDSYELHLEHMVTADTLFIFLGTVAVVILCWNDRPSVPVMAVAGLLIGYATLVRSVGQPLLVVVLVAMLARRAGWRRLVALLVAGRRAHRGVHVLVPRHVRQLRADRVLGHVPVQPGQHLRRVLQDAPARPTSGPCATRRHPSCARCRGSTSGRTTNCRRSTASPPRCST